MKTFKVDDFNISISDELFNAAVNCYDLEPGDTEEEKRGNLLYIKNAIRAGSCKTLEDLGRFSFEKLRKEKTDEEISEAVAYIIKDEIKTNGGVCE